MVAPTQVASLATGSLDLVTASFLGGSGEEVVNACAIQSDGTIILAGAWGGGQAAGVSAVSLGGESGFVARLASDGTAWKGLALLPGAVEAMTLDPNDRPIVLTVAAGGAQQVHVLDKAAGRIERTFEAGSGKSKGDQSIALDGNGDVLALAGSSVVRFAPDGATRWTQKLPAHGESRPFALAVEPSSGICVAVGYGMTRTRKEPYKDPYAHAFDRAGKAIWTLWNPDPKTVGSDTPVHLEADGTGHRVAATPDGRFLVHVFHDGGNAVSQRDPLDPSKPLDPKVLGDKKKGIKESFQNGPGWGMKGAITTSVVFRVDPATGTLERGTWMCAWMNNHTRANSLTMRGLAGDEQGRVLVVGDSASSCPVKDPWFAWRPTEYQGGGFVAFFDRDFQMIRCGTLASSSLQCVATRNGLVVAAGRASDRKKNKDGSIVPHDADNQPRTKAPLQAAPAGGMDGYFAVFRVK